MQFLTENFMWFLVSTAVFVVLFFVYASARMKRFQNDPFNTKPFDGMIWLGLCSLGATGSFIVFLIGFITYLVKGG